MRQITAIAAAAQCQSWCTDHANGTPASRWPQPDDQICRRPITSAEFGGFLVAFTIEDGTTVNLYNVRDELTLAQTKQFARALLAQVELAEQEQVEQ